MEEDRRGILLEAGRSEDSCLSHGEKKSAKQLTVRIEVEGGAGDVFDS